MRSADAARRWAAVAALVASVAALVATSPGGPPVTPLTSQATSAVELTAEAPVASVRVAVEISDEALWSDDPEIQTGEADVRVTGRTRYPQQTDADRVTYLDIPIVNLRLVDAAGQPQASETVLFASERIDLLEACQPDLDCVLEFDAVVEWVDARPGTSAVVELMADAQVAITGPEEVPVGATIALHLADAVATDAVVRSDQVEGTASLDAEHPMATWTIRASADAGAIPEEVRWPTDGRMAFVSGVEVTGGTEEDRRPGTSPPIRILVFDETGAELPGTVRRFDAFRDCTPGVTCEAELTVIAQWLGARGDEQVKFDWRLYGGIVYHGPERPADDAEIELVVAHVSVAGGDGPSLEASIEGELTFDTSAAGLQTSRLIRLDVPEAAMDARLIGGPVPALSGRLTVSGTTSGPATEGLQPLLLRLEREPTGVSTGYSLDPVPNGEPTGTIVFPAIDCRAERACRVTHRLSAGILANDLDLLEGETVTVQWRLDVALQYPEGTELPDGLVIGLSDDDP